MARNKYDIDETLNTPFKWNHFKRSLVYVKKHIVGLLQCFIMSLITIVLGLFAPKFTQIIVDTYIPDKNIGGIVFLCSIFAISILISSLINAVRIGIMANIGQGIITDIRYDLFTHMQKLPFSFYDSRPSGKILVRVVNYVNSVSDFLSAGILSFVLELISIFIILAFMFTTSVRLSFVILSGLPILVAFIYLIKNAQRRAWQIQSNKASNLNAYIHESISGMKITQLFTREGLNMEICTKLCRAAAASFQKAVLITFTMPYAVDIISQFVIVAMYLTAFYFTDTKLTAGIILAMLGYCSRFWAPILNMGNLYNSLITSASYLERIFETMDEPVKIDDKPGAVPLKPISGKVEFKDVIFSYDKGQPILKNVGFIVQPGESIALVGPTGAGKSTIVNLVSRFYDLDSGQILIDDVDISTVTIKSLRQQMGIMLQDSFIFSGNIYDNIRFGKLDATKEEMEAAAKTVCAHDFISKFPSKYETSVNERGSTLSAGQRQLVSFARTLISDPKILVLDEATSAIDTKTEQQVQEGLINMLKGRTSFIIAHRLSTIKNCTKIMYIEDGQIVECGSHDELMSKKCQYYKLYTSQ